MRVHRVTIAGMMGLTAALSVGLLMLRDPTHQAASVYVSGIGTALAAATVLALVRHGRERGAWIGFAVFGAGYFLWAFGYDHVPLPSPFTRQVLDAAEPYLYPYNVASPSVYVGTPSAAFLSGIKMRVSVRPAFDFLAYRQMGHAVCTLLLGLCGAWLGYAATRPGEGMPASSEPPAKHA
jgi:hypothetical protein